MGTFSRAMAAIPPDMQDTCQDFRQLVNRMVALAAAALAEPGLPQPTRAQLEHIMEQAEWLAAMVKHSLYTTGLEAPGSCRADLRRVAHDAVAAERVTWPGEMRIIGAAGRVPVAVDSVLLRRMIANLLANATRAAGPTGTVTLDIGFKRRLAMLAIEDTGPGFGKIERGFGIGLAEVSRCVAAHGGRLDHGCCADGGARVSLWLPRAIGPESEGPGDSEAGTT
jgi:signal transduction histidine kinase